MFGWFKRRDDTVKCETCKHLVRRDDASWVTHETWGGGKDTYVWYCPEHGKPYTYVDEWGKMFVDDQRVNEAGNFIDERGQRYYTACEYQTVVGALAAALEAASAAPKLARRARPARVRVETVVVNPPSVPTLSLTLE